MTYFKELKKYSVGITVTNAIVSSINAIVSIANSPSTLCNDWAFIAASIAIFLEFILLVLVLFEMISNSTIGNWVKSWLCCLLRRFIHHEAQ